VEQDAKKKELINKINEYNGSSASKTTSKEKRDIMSSIKQKY
jgi:hypothetical protein